MCCFTYLCCEGDMYKPFHSPYQWQIHSYIGIHCTCDPMRKVPCTPNWVQVPQCHWSLAFNSGHAHNRRLTHRLTGEMMYVLMYIQSFQDFLSYVTVKCTLQSITLSDNGLSYPTHVSSEITNTEPPHWSDWLYNAIHNWDKNSWMTAWICQRPMTLQDNYYAILCTLLVCVVVLYTVIQQTNISGNRWLSTHLGKMDC